MSTRRMVLAGALSLAALPASVRAQAGRNTPRLIVGSAPGGPADMQGRALAEAMRRAGGPMTIVENRPGAAGRLSVMALRQSPADGSALLLAPGWQLSLAPQTDTTTTFDPFQDLVPIGGICEQEFALVIGPRSSAKTLAEFAAQVKKTPGGELCASGGLGSMGHLVGVMFERSAGIQLQPVPYRGAAPALQDVQAGHVASYAGALGDMIRLHREGAVRVLATSGPRRSVFLPDVPTFKEAGHPEVVAVDWTAVFAPKGLSTATGAALGRILKGSMGDRPLLDMLERMGVEARYLEPDEVSRRLRHDFETMRGLVKAYNLTARS